MPMLDITLYNGAQNIDQATQKALGCAVLLANASTPRPTTAFDSAVRTCQDRNLHCVGRLKPLEAIGLTRWQRARSHGDVGKPLLSAWWLRSRGGCGDRGGRGRGAIDRL